MNAYRSGLYIVFGMGMGLVLGSVTPFNDVALAIGVFFIGGAALTVSLRGNE